MQTLKKFNQIYNKLIFEQTENQQKQSKEICDCQSFFNVYIAPLALKCKVIAQKQRYNVFRISGAIADVYKFFDSFKVDKQFMEQPQNFYILSPVVTFGQIKHFYNNGTYTKLFNRTFSQGNQLISAGNDILTSRQVDDINQYKIEGRWYNLYYNTEKNEDVPDYNVPKLLRKCTPVQLKKSLETFIDKVVSTKQNYFVCVEFSINCDKLMNNSYDQITTSIPITFGDKNKINDVSDRMNAVDKILKPTVITKLQPSEDSSLVGDTRKQLRSINKKQFNTKNKVKNIKTSINS